MESFRLYLLVACSLTACVTALALSDGESLQAIRDAWNLNGSWWQGDDPCEGWKGVQCDANNRVSALNLSNTGIYGPIPDEIGNLIHLINLDVCNGRNSKPPYNHISGDLSPLGSLTNLLHLNVSINRIQLNTFPTVIFKLSNLITLRIDNNLISGPVPAELANLRNLTYLYVGNNSFTGPIPVEFSKLVNLRELSMWETNLLSTIPPEFGALQNLQYLNLHDCSLYGGLPKELGNIKSLQNISLYRNQLTGPLPDSWGNLTNLKALTLISNFLTKPIPSGVFSLPNLVNLSVDYNLFDGGLDLDNVNVSAISVTCNYLSGAAPVPSNRTTSLNLTGNCFTGSDADPKIRCSQLYYDCNTFFEAIQNGGCPTCPPQQSLHDPVTCVCMLNTATGGSSPNKGHEGAILGGAIGGVFALIVCVLLLWCKWARTHKRSMKDEWEGPDGVQRFQYSDLSKATNGFDSSNEVGAGGFGKVYYGIVDGRPVAIKLAHASSIQSSSGFRNEVILLSRLHHRNLVRLLGFCEEEQIQVLVYEYMPNGNLHDLIFKNQNTIKLDWLRRLDIALGVAHGLEYLHSFADPPVIHRDVKPSNVLLDENLVAKVSDFGISREATEFQTQFATRPAGTVGYIDPQYMLREVLNTASDVYSFGMVLLELITGQKSIDNTRIDDYNLVEWVKLKLKTDDLKDIIDPRLGNDYPEKVYHDIIRLGVDCASFESKDRPSMKVALSILDACRWSVASQVCEEGHMTGNSFLSEEDGVDSAQTEAVPSHHNSSSVSGSSCSFNVTTTLLPR